MNNWMQNSTNLHHLSQTLGQKPRGDRGRKPTVLASGKHVCNTRKTSSAAHHRPSADDCVAVGAVDGLGASDEGVDLDPE
jgi:hypothetical protein